MQCNLKTNEGNSERHNLFRGGGSLFDLRFTPTTWRCMWVLDVYEETQLLWHMMVKVNVHPNGLGVPHEGCHPAGDWLR